MSSEFDIHSLRFYGIEQIINNEPMDGWSVETLLARMQEYSPSVTDKQIRTLLTGLENAGLLTVEKEGKTKHYFLDRFSRTAGEDEESEAKANQSKSFLGLASIYTAMLSDMNLEDLGPSADRLKKQLSYVINDPETRRRISTNSSRILINSNAVSRLTRKQTEHLDELMSNAGKVFLLKTTEGKKVSFYFDFAVIRNTSLKVCGVETAAGAYTEFALREIESVESSSGSFNTNKLSPKESAKLLAGRNTVDEPRGLQPEQIRVSLNDEVLHKISSRAMPIDFDIDYKTSTLHIEHEPTEELADWLISLGPGAVVKEPHYFKEVVFNRIAEIMNGYAGKAKN